MEKRWSKTEIAHLRRHAESQSVEELAQRFHTDTETVRRMLEKLDLSAGGSSQATTDAVIENYEEGLRHLHSAEWQSAADRFELVIRDADSQQMIDRAQQNLAICQRHLEPPQEDVEPYLLAVVAKNQGDLEQALEFCGQGPAAGDEKYAYLAASINALAGEEDRALELLSQAIDLEPKNRVHAYHDPDFQGLRGHEGFSDLIAESA